MHVLKSTRQIKSLVTTQDQFSSYFPKLLYFSVMNMYWFDSRKIFKSTKMYLVCKWSMSIKNILM